MKYVRYLWILILMIEVVSCNRNENELLSNESYRIVCNAFGQPKKRFFEVAEGKDMAINAVLYFDRSKIENLNYLVEEYNLVNPEDSDDIPLLWLHTSSWSNFTNESPETKALIDYIIDKKFENIFYMYGSDKSIINRIIICKEYNGDLIVLIEYAQ